MDIQKRTQTYVDGWALTIEGELALTPMGAVYKVHTADGLAVLKVFTEEGMAEGARAATTLNWFNGHGAARVYRRDGQACLMEYAPEPDALTHMVAEGEDDEASRIIARVAAKLHSPVQKDIPPDMLRMEDRFAPLVGADLQSLPKETRAMFEQAGEVARDLLSTQTEDYVLHGDLNHHNVLHHPERGWLAIDPKGYIGERCYDLANTLCNPLALPKVVVDAKRLKQQAHVLAQEGGCDEKRLLAYGFVEAAVIGQWCFENQIDDRHFTNVAEVARKLF